LSEGRPSRDWSWAALGIVAALAVVTLVGEYRRPLNPDAAWLLYAAGRVLQGERLYSDLLEINPPLIVWLNLPVAWVSRVTGWPDAAVFRAAVLGLVALSCALTVGLARGFGRAYGRWVLAAVLFVLLPLVGGMFGQREHLLLALVLPLVSLTVLRIEQLPMSTGAAAAIGLMGAAGIALKPHYAAGWLLMVAYRCWSGGRRARPLMPEDVAVVGAGIAYPLLALVLTPDYFRLVAGAARDYLSYGWQPLRYVLLDDSPALWFYVALVVWLLFDRGMRRIPRSGVLAAMGVGAVVAVALQHKGWSYHYLPLTACAFLLAASTLASAGGGTMGSVARLAYGVMVLLFAGTMSALVARRAFGPLDPREQRQVAVHEAVAGQIGARTILVLSSQLRDAFPLTNDVRLRWVGGYANMWMSLVYYSAGRQEGVAYHSPPAMPEGERQAFDRTVRAVVDGRPDVLVVESPALNARRNRRASGFDFLGYLSQDSSCAEALSRYRRMAEVDSLWVLRRVTGESRLGTRSH
jgi:hypothetical protein